MNVTIVMVELRLAEIYFGVTHSLRHKVVCARMIRYLCGYHALTLLQKMTYISIRLLIILRIHYTLRLG